MVPSVYVGLEGLPRTGSGKVDRKGLPAPEAVGEAQGGLGAADAGGGSGGGDLAGGAGTGASVGWQENFFELGGHSLLATQIVSRVREALAVELPLRSIFEDPTIAGMALAILQRRGEATGADELERLACRARGGARRSPSPPAVPHSAPDVASSGTTSPGASPDSHPRNVPFSKRASSATPPPSGPGTIPRSPASRTVSPLFRPAAALVPRPARAGTRPLQRRRGVPVPGVRSIRTRSSGLLTGWSPGTTRCGRASPSWTASRCSGSIPGALSRSRGRIRGGVAEAQRERDVLRAGETRGRARIRSLARAPLPGDALPALRSRPRPDARGRTTSSPTDGPSA